MRNTDNVDNTSWGDHRPGLRGPGWREQRMADYLEISKSTLRRMRRRGQVPWFRTPTGMVRYRPHEVEKVLQEHGILI